MAEIPVERKEKGGFPWWLIPLLLLLLLLPLLWFCTRDNASNTNTNTNANGNANRAGVATSTANNLNGGTMNNGANGTSGIGNTAVVVNSANGNGSMGNGSMNNGSMSNTAAGGGAAVSDVNMFGTTTDKATLVGRSSNLSGVRVERVLSDKVFTVKSGTGEMFVMLDDNLDSGGGKEQQIKMKPGQNVNLNGTFRNVPTGETTAETKGGGLNNKEYAQLKGQNVYLHATSVSDVK